MTALAAKAGLSRAMISFVESEFRNPSLETLLRITYALGINLSRVIAKADAAIPKLIDSRKLKVKRRRREGKKLRRRSGPLRGA